MKEERNKYARMRGSKIIEVIVSEVNEGEGTPEDPIVRVAYLYSKKGELLAKIGERVERLFCEGDFMTRIGTTN